MVITRCKLKRTIQRRLLLLFEAGTSARTAAALLSINRNSSALFYRKIRRAIHESRQNAGKLRGVVEVDECYTSSGEGGRKVARQGRGLAGKIALQGAVSRGDRRVRIERIRATTEEILCGFVERNVERRAAVHTDSFRGYNGLRRRGFRHYRVNHFLQFKDFKSGACTNLIESVWACLRRHFARFCGGWRNNLELWIAEIEFRVEKKLPVLHKELLKILRK